MKRRTISTDLPAAPQGFGNAEHTTQMRVGWSRPGMTKALRYKENGTMVFFESLKTMELKAGLSRG